ncbi:MAG: hypothetical protein KF804_02160 [Burkholderiales bacterium]|nr:hypothetical protein [Burkholderiales bacterium]
MGMPIRMPLLAVLLCCAATAFAAERAPRGMAFEVYIRLEHGMTEGELVHRAGKPDRRTTDRADQALKTYHYLPTRAYPFLTTVSLRSGRIVHIERVRRKPQ